MYLHNTHMTLSNFGGCGRLLAYTARAQASLTSLPCSLLTPAAGQVVLYIWAVAAAPTTWAYGRQPSAPRSIPQYAVAEPVSPCPCTTAVTAV